jgi:hypothetical protein
MTWLTGVLALHCIRLTTVLDDCYYTLYYCLDVHARSQQKQQYGGGSQRSPSSGISPPHVHFTSGICSPDATAAQNALLKAYLTRSCSTRVLELLVQSWDPVLGDVLTDSTALSTQSSSSKKDSNFLLQLHFARWRETICLLDALSLIPDTSQLAQMLQSLRPQVLDNPSSATMKGTDPLLPAGLREWADCSRVWPCHLYAFATPNNAALQKIASCAPVLEIGAGTGYWSHLLRTSFPNTAVVAYDKDPPTQQGKVVRPNDYHGKSRAWTTVLKGGPEVAAQYPGHALFLCYPPPDSAMGLLALRAYKGDTVCYVGS